jgi:hypothetical protein
MELLFGTSVLFQYTGTVGRFLFCARVDLKCFASQWFAPVQTGCQGVDASGYEFLEFSVFWPGAVPVPQGVCVNTSCTE